MTTTQTIDADRTFAKRFNADRFIKSHGLLTTHEAKQVGKGEYVIRPKQPNGGDVESFLAKRNGMKNIPAATNIEAAAARKPSKPAPAPRKAVRPAAKKTTRVRDAAQPKATKRGGPGSRKNLFDRLLPEAQAGKMPAAPDFSAETHARYRDKLAEVVKMAKAGDVKGLRAFSIKPISSSPIAIDRYRRLAIIAIEAKKAKR